MRAADFISRELMQEMLKDLRPETSNSIECVKLINVPGNDRNPHILAEVIDSNGFSDYPIGRVVMVPENAFLTIPVGSHKARLFVRVKSIVGTTKRQYNNRITNTNRYGSDR